MKMRWDYVTNSSSSSFIVAFDSADIAEELGRERWRLKGNYQKLLDDLSNSEITYEEAMSIFEEDAKDKAICEIMDSIERNQGYDAAMDFLNNYDNNDEYIEMVDRKTGKLENDFSRRIMDKAYIAFVKYDDHNDYVLEQEVMPYLKCTMHTINEH